MFPRSAARWLASVALAAGLSASLLPPAGYPVDSPPLRPGEDWATSVFVRNSDDLPRHARLRVRLRGHHFWGSPEQRAVRGPWTALEPMLLQPGEDREVPCTLQVPLGAPPVLAVEVRGMRPHVRGWDRRRPHLVEPFPGPVEEAVPGSTRVPFRILGGGIASYDGEEAYTRPVWAGVARTAEEWRALRVGIGIAPPEEWGLPETPSRHALWPARFASATAPDPGRETLLVLRTEDFCERYRPLGLWIRSVESRADGSLLCRYSYRARSLHPGGPRLGVCNAGSWLLAAIPRTDAPVEFVRVP